MRLFEIRVGTLDQMVLVCADLVREGICFRVTEWDRGWIIEPTGGF